MIDAVSLAQALVRCPSVTPADAGAMAVVEEALAALGFATRRLTWGAPPDGPVVNLFASIGSGAPHFAFAGHTDVVPPGGGWSVDPFAGTVAGGMLIGRGAADMKGAIAAMVAAASAHVARGRSGTLSFILTGDEEGPATFGTERILGWMEEHGIRPDGCLVGEPTSRPHLGDMLKIGRRGSLNAWIGVPGAQGHVAYPDLADNPIPRLVAILAQIKAVVLDAGTDFFQPSNIEITELHTGNPATNVIPAKALARLSIRFNDLHSGESLVELIRGIVEQGGGTLKAMISGEAFLTPPGELSETLAAVVEEVTGIAPEASTTGGTSAARFISKLCPVDEFGLCNSTMHTLDEAVAIADLDALAEIYRRVTLRLLSA
jgi:succinyl-diaminopimelate desuccinylase